MLASVATNSSRCKIAPAALLELNNACDLFQRASAFGGRAVKFLVSLPRPTSQLNTHGSSVRISPAYYAPLADEGSASLPGRE